MTDETCAHINFVATDIIGKGVSSAAFRGLRSERFLKRQIVGDVTTIRNVFINKIIAVCVNVL